MTTPAGRSRPQTPNDLTGDLPSQRTSPETGSLPAVSVIVPTVDREVLLRRAVTSVIAQDYTGEIEVIVVRDGGPEPEQAQLRLAQSLRRELTATDGRVRLRWVANTRSKGLPGARNSGILTAGHELVAFCDDDDEWRPGKLSAQVPVLQRERGASLVASGLVVLTDTAGGVQENLRPGPLRPVNLGDLLADRIMELHPSSFLLHRADLLGPIGLIDEDLPGGYAEDYDLLLRAAAIGPVISVPRPLVAVHWHGSSYYFSKWQMINAALERLLDKHPQFRAVPRGEARIRGQQAVALVAMGRRRDGLLMAVRALRLHPGEKRAYLAAAVATGLIDMDRVQNFLHSRGRGL